MIIFGSSILFSSSLEKVVRFVFKAEFVQAKFPNRLLIHCIPGFIYTLSVEISTPSYNTISFAALYCVGACVLSTLVSGKRIYRKGAYVAVGLLSFIGFLGKPFVLIGCLIMIAMTGMRRIIEAVLGVLIGILFFPIFSQRNTSFIDNFVISRELAYKVSTGYETSNLISDALNSIRYSVGGFFVTEVKDLGNWLVLLIIIVVLLKQRNYSILLNLELIALWVIIKCSLVRFEESRNGIIYVVLLVICLRILQLTKLKSLGVSETSMLLCATAIVLIIPPFFAFGTMAGGLMPKWGQAAGIVLSLFLILSLYAEQLLPRKQSFSFKINYLLTILVLIGQIAYVFINPQHTSGGIKRNTSLVYQSISPIWIEEKQRQLFKIVEETKLQSEYINAVKRDAILLDLTDFQTTLAWIIGLRTAKTIVMLSPEQSPGKLGQQADIEFLKFALLQQKKFEPGSLDSPIILLSKEFSNCSWETNKCKLKGSLSGIEKVISQFIKGYPMSYSVIAELDENILIVKE